MSLHQLDNFQWIHPNNSVCTGNNWCLQPSRLRHYFNSQAKINHDEKFYIKVAILSTWSDAVVKAHSSRRTKTRREKLHENHTLAEIQVSGG